MQFICASCLSPMLTLELWYKILMKTLNSNGKSFMTTRRPNRLAGPYNICLEPVWARSPRWFWQHCGQTDLGQHHKRNTWQVISQRLRLEVDLTLERIQISASRWMWSDKQYNTRWKYDKSPQRQKHWDSKQNCQWCNRMHDKNYLVCIKRCSKCNKMCHFEVVCKTRTLK